MRMKDIPWFNRPWTKIKRNGVGSLDDAELLALIFVRGNKENSSLDLANKLLSRYNFHKFSIAATKDLTNILGEELKAFQVKAISEICKRHSKLNNKGFTNTIESALNVYNFFKDDLSDKKQEHLYTLLLNAKNRIISSELISVGSLTKSFAHPRAVFRTAIKEAANSIILVHNHPSGDPNPSKEDIVLTKKIIRAGQILGIKLLDHIIIGKEKYWSYLEHKK